MKMIGKYVNKKGFTVIEFLIVLGLIGLITQMIFAFYFYNDKVFTIATEQSSVQQNIRLLAEYINEELRDAKAVSNREEMISADFDQYYALKLRNEGDQVYLVKEVIDSTNKKIQNKIGYALTSLLFFTVDTNTLSVTIKNQDFSLESRILLNNIEELNTPKEGFSTIFYGKNDN